MGSEIELKLTIDPTDVARLRHRLTSMTAKRRHDPHRRLVSTYFDTKSFSLAQESLSLRIRKIGHRRIQTIKRAPSNGGSVITRAEWENAIQSDRPNLRSPEVSARVYAVLNDKAHRILTARHSAIVDAVFAQPQERGALTDVAKAINVRLQGLFLTASLETRLARVSTRSSDASDADEAVARAQECYDLGPIDWIPIDASGTVEETLARAQAVLDQHNSMI